ATGQLDNPSRIKQVKKDIARMLTELRNREIAEAEGLAYEEMPGHVAAAHRRSRDEALGRDRSTAAERRAAARAADEEEAARGADEEEETDLERAADDGMGEAVGGPVAAEGDEDGSS
ncbi:MAG TPA: 50S ribosomal protein L29, partial [Acidimicrobiales bacterium]|nr:50S ribosomal protein L29 [Acidimicrobiales bacterium]